MNTTTYDIFELAEDLKKANINDEAIKAIVKFEKAKDETMLNALATKDDIKTLYRHINTFGYLLCGLIIVGVSLLGFMIAYYGK